MRILDSDLASEDTPLYIQYLHLGTVWSGPLWSGLVSPGLLVSNTPHPRACGRAAGWLSRFTNADEVIRNDGEDQY